MCCRAKNVFSNVLQINMVGEPFLNVNCDHLRAFDENLYRQLICYPQVKYCACLLAVK